MKSNRRRMVIVGGGIAGLCTAVYAQKCGYQVEVLEMHEAPGGLATSWHRGGYTFETCLNWLLGSNPAGDMYRQWKEVFDIEKLRFVHHEEFLRIETDKGDSLRIYSNLDQLELEMLKRAPQEQKQVHHFISSVRHLCTFQAPRSGKELAWELEDFPQRCSPTFAFGATLQDDVCRVRNALQRSTHTGILYRWQLRAPLRSCTILLSRMDE